MDNSCSKGEYSICTLRHDCENECREYTQIIRDDIRILHLSVIRVKREDRILCKHRYKKRLNCGDNYGLKEMWFDPWKVFLRAAIERWIDTNDITPLCMKFSRENEERSYDKLQKVSYENLIKPRIARVVLVAVQSEYVVC